MNKRIVFTVTNDLSYDQRMHRICGTLAKEGYQVLLVGRKLPSSPPLEKKEFQQKRLHCWFRKGKRFYAEYNIRLFLFLLFTKLDAICAIDLDTILPCFYVSKLRRKKRIYDAHELFTELKEVVSRPSVKKAWDRIEKKAVPQFRYGYTVSESIAEEFHRRYGVNYATIRNMPLLKTLPADVRQDKYLLYQGAVNEARGFEWLIPAMKNIPAKLVVCGDGNFMTSLKELIALHKVEDKVILHGQLFPTQLWEIATKAWIGMAVAENMGMNQYLALPNKFFDYVQAGLPQVTMNFPEYRKLNGEYEVALLIDDPQPSNIAAAVNKLFDDNVLYQRLRANCLQARQTWNWEHEEKKLIEFYRSVFKD